MAQIGEQSSLITKTILKILEDNKGTILTFSKLVAEVIKEANLKPSDSTRIKVIANSLISGGLASGRFDATISFKARESSGGFSTESKDSSMGGDSTGSGFSDIRESAYKADNERLKKELEGHKLAVAELGTQLKTLKETYRQSEELMLKRIKDAEGKTRVVSVQLLRGEEEVKTIDGVFHDQFEKVLKLAQARMNVFIYGPTGCGKSHLCKQIADALNLPFYFVSCTAGMGESTLGGRLLPIGKANQMTYVASEFIQAYEKGGVFLLDEMDAADANVLLLINSALANGRVAVTNRPGKPYAERHQDFVCIAAANTIGTGADRMYSGRHKLDASTLDRFSIGKVFMDYDPQVEAQLCPDDVLRNVLLSYRKKIDGARLERAMSTRFMRDAYRMKSEFGYTVEDINLAYFQGWREDEVNKVKSPFMK